MFGRKSLPHLGNTGHQPGQQQQPTKGALHAMAPVYTAAIFVFFLYIIVKVRHSV